jgi:lysozyme
MCFVFEGFCSTVYKDDAGKNTIGFGHLCKTQEPCLSVTCLQAEELLLQDAQTAEDCIRKYVSQPLTANQYQAVLSFVYNEGCTTFRQSSVLEDINNNHLENVPEDLLKYDKICSGNPKECKTNQGLVKRRDQEGKIFSTPDSSACTKYKISYCKGEQDKCS